MKEIWKDVIGYEGLYKISNLGRVKNRFDLILKPNTTRGYKIVSLSKNNTQKTYKLHSLVALNFLGKRAKGGLQVNHIDGNKLNNKVSNLEYVTRSKNVKHAYSLGLMDKRGHKNCKAKLSVIEVLEIRNRYIRGESISEIAKDYSIHICNVRRIINRTTWKHI